MPGYQISRKLGVATLVAISIASLVTISTVQAEQATPSTTAQRVQTKLDELEAWISKGDQESSKLQRWQKYLLLDDLREQLEEPEPDPAVVVRSLRKFRTGANGLNLRRFVAVRNALADWSRELKTPGSGKLADYAAAARGDHSPITQQQLATSRENLKRVVRDLDQALSATPHADAWKTYLRWELLEKQLKPDAKVTRAALTNLVRVLRRFRKNEPGLENDEFREVAKALEQYIPTLTWATTAKVRDASAAYDGLLKSLQQQLERHVERPTGETQWKISRVFRLAKQLGDSPQLVSAIESQINRPNLFVRVSENLVNRTAQRPVSNQQPVVDCILGTSIRGTANTFGTVTFDALPSDQQIVMNAVFTGQTASRTVGYQKPVKIYSTGTTTFRSTKQLLFSDEAFFVTPATADALTRTRINSIRKTGGKFGRRLVEKIAWKRAGESKSQAERIAASHAEVKIEKGLDEQVFPAMFNGRKMYLAKVITPLLRRDLVPGYLRMHSTDHDLRIDATIARSTQLGSATSPEPLQLGHDFSVQIHDSAVNNYLPLALAGVTLSQDEADMPQKVTGDAPAWLKKVQNARRATNDVAEAITEPVLKDPNQTSPGNDEEAANNDLAENDFQPWSITLNEDFPVSVSFKEGKMAIRMRASQLASAEREFKNWDFVVTYQFTANGNGMLLRRVGKIEVLPTGFDPEWDKRMSTAKSGFRNTLAKNLNARAERGEGFPREIPIPPVVIPDLGELTLRQLDSDNGWLTLGWGLPPR